VSARTPLILGNWKMHKTASAARTMLSALRDRVDGLEGIDCGVAPPFTALPAAAEVVSGSRLLLGAQNLNAAEEGAYTGEISAVMLVDAGAHFVIVGHSERRTLFGETDADVAAKLRTALAHDLLPVVCCGETLEQREAGETVGIVRGQLEGALGSLAIEDAARVVLAYEPIWAIGTGRTATPEQAQEVHASIRDWLRGRFDTAAGLIRVLYGGSVKPDNTAELLAGPDIDGALVGGASLEAAAFAAIVEAADAR
jgi:triosephosphate isomerase